MMSSPNSAWLSENTVITPPPEVSLLTPGITRLYDSMSRGMAVMNTAPRIGPKVVPTPPTTMIAM
jgi:hypothetical protein